MQNAFSFAMVLYVLHDKKQCQFKLWSEKVLSIGLLNIFNMRIANGRKILSALVVYRIRIR